MIQPLITPYEADRDRLAIKRMLADYHYYSDMFKESADDYPDCIWVALLQKQLVGVLFHDGLQRGTEFTIFVDETYRRKGFGTQLLSAADQMFRKNDDVERAKCASLTTDDASLSFLTQNGYQLDHSMFLMKRDACLLPITETKAHIRHYQNEDYFVFQSLLETVFYDLRKRLGYQLWYREASENDKHRFLNDKENRYVMILEGQIIAIGILYHQTVEAIAVRQEYQAQGYGKSFMSFLVNELIGRRAETIQLWVDYGNEAKLLYENLGFTDLAQYQFLSRRYRPETRPSGPPPKLE